MSTFFEVFDYSSDKFGYKERLKKWREVKTPIFMRTSSVERSLAGFEPSGDNDMRMKCSFCGIVLYESSSNEQLMADHVMASPDCSLVQSEINYRPNKPQYSSWEAREKSFSENQRFLRIRAGFEQRELDRIVKMLVENGFYFASEVNVFDQVKCFFCAASFSCDIFGSANLTEEILTSNHAHQCRTCTFLISELGTVHFDHLLSQRCSVQLPKYKKRRKPKENISENPETILLGDETELAPSEAERQNHNLRALINCKVCSINRSNILFLPCNHISSCAKCILNISSCPLCEHPFSDFIPVLFG